MSDSTDAKTLPALPDESWTRVLCVVAHPDDMEYGASAAVATWARRGVNVTYLLLTSGEAGMQRPSEEVGPLRAAEQQRACETVGGKDLIILDHPDGMLMPTLDLRRDIARVVRQVRPQAVVTANFDFEAYGGLSQADHRAAGLATVDAVRDADNTWVFRDLADDEGLPKWHTQWLLVAGHPDATHAMAVDAAAVEAAVGSLECHQAYLADLPGHPKPAEFIPVILAEGGKAAGVGHAVLFKGYDLGVILRWQRQAPWPARIEPRRHRASSGSTSRPPPGGCRCRSDAPPLRHPNPGSAPPARPRGARPRNLDRVPRSRCGSAGPTDLPNAARRDAGPASKDVGEEEGTLGGRGIHDLDLEVLLTPGQWLPEFWSGVDQGQQLPCEGSITREEVLDRVLRQAAGSRQHLIALAQPLPSHRARQGHCVGRRARWARGLLDLPVTILVAVLAVLLGTDPERQVLNATS